MSCEQNIMLAHKLAVYGKLDAKKKQIAQSDTNNKTASSREKTERDAQKAMDKKH